MTCNWEPPLSGPDGSCHLSARHPTDVSPENSNYCLGGFKKALLQNPREMIRGRIFSEVIRIQARKSELQPESRSYRPKVRVTAGQTPKIRTKSPGNGTRIGFWCFCRKPP